MLILTRRPGESLHLGDHIKITVLGVQGKQIKIGLEVPMTCSVSRGVYPGAGAEPAGALRCGIRCPGGGTAMAKKDERVVETALGV
jgi:hypothetical protein